MQVITQTEKQNITIEMLTKGGKRGLRNLFRETETNFHDIIDIRDRLNAVVQEMEEQREQEENERKAKSEQIEKVRAMMEELGISLEDMGASDEIIPSEKKPRKPMPQRETVDIEYVDSNGKKVIVNRVPYGRTKGDLKQYLEDTGKKLSDCIVGRQKDDNATTEKEEPKKDKKKNQQEVAA